MKEILNKIYQYVCPHEDFDCVDISFSTLTGTNCPDHKLICKKCGSRGIFTKVSWKYEPIDILSKNVKVKELILNTPRFN